MAITQNPLIGRAKGRFGTAVFTTLFGQNILKTLPVSVFNPKTDLQKMVREKFLAAALFVKSIYEWCKLAFPPRAMGMSPFAAVLKSVVAATSGTLGNIVVNPLTSLDSFVKYINPSWIIVTPTSNTLTTVWSYSNPDFGAVEGDIIDVLAINITTGDVDISSGPLDSHLALELGIVIPYTTATDDYAIFSSVRKYAGSKATSHVAKSFST